MLQLHDIITFRVFSHKTLFLDASEYVGSEGAEQSTVYVNDKFTIPMIHGNIEILSLT